MFFTFVLHLLLHEEKNTGWSPSTVVFSIYNRQTHEYSNKEHHFSFM